MSTLKNRTKASNTVEKRLAEAQLLKLFFSVTIF